MRSKRCHRRAVLVTLVLVGLSGCGSSAPRPGGDGPATGTGTSAASTPAKDLRVTSQLEKFVTDEWNGYFADAGNANYEKGVTVAKVTCVPEAGTTRSQCTVTSSAGRAKAWWYVVAPDGSSAERSEQQG